jgi:Zn-dependent M28 family amino/carboxypeptidase
MKAYVANPPVPLARTLANINFDMLNLEGPTLDIVGLGSDETKLGRMFVAAAHAEGTTQSPVHSRAVPVAPTRSRTHAGMSVSGDPNPGQGSFIRSDSWVFHKAGIPSIYPWTGKHFVGRPSDFAATRKYASIAPARAVLHV